MEPRDPSVWARPGYFILPTSSLKGVALNWTKREHDAELPLICSGFPGEQSSQQSSVGQSSWRICTLLFLSQAWGRSMSADKIRE